MKKDPFGLKRSDNRPSIFGSSISGQSTAFGSSMASSRISTARDIFKSGSLSFSGLGNSIFGGSVSAQDGLGKLQQKFGGQNYGEELDEREDLEWAESDEEITENEGIA